MSNSVKLLQETKAVLTSQLAELDRQRKEIQGQIETIEKTILITQSVEKFKATKWKFGGKVDDGNKTLPYQMVADTAENGNSARLLELFDKAGRFKRKAYFDEILGKEGVSPEAVRSSLSYLKKNKTIDSIKVGANNVNTFWGLSVWFDFDDTPKKEHVYDEQDIFVKKIKPDKPAL